MGRISEEQKIFNDIMYLIYYAIFKANVKKKWLV